MVSEKCTCQDRNKEIRRERVEKKERERERSSK